MSAASLRVPSSAPAWTTKPLLDDHQVNGGDDGQAHQHADDGKNRTRILPHRSRHVAVELVQRMRAGERSGDMASFVSRSHHEASGAWSPWDAASGRSP